MTTSLPVRSRTGARPRAEVLVLVVAEEDHGVRLPLLQLRDDQFVGVADSRVAALDVLVGLGRDLRLLRR